MFTNYMNTKIITLFVILILVSSAFIIKAQGGKNEKVKINTNNFQIDSQSHVKGYHGFLDLSTKNHRIFDLPFSYEFSRVSSPLYLGLIDNRKSNRNFLDTYHSLVFNLKFPLFQKN